MGKGVDDPQIAQTGFLGNVATRLKERRPFDADVVTEDVNDFCEARRKLDRGGGGIEGGSPDCDDEFVPDVDDFSVTRER